MAYGSRAMKSPASWMQSNSGLKRAMAGDESPIRRAETGRAVKLGGDEIAFELDPIQLGRVKVSLARARKNGYAELQPL